MTAFLLALAFATGPKDPWRETRPPSGLFVTYGKEGSDAVVIHCLGWEELKTCEFRRMRVERRTEGSCAVISYNPDSEAAFRWAGPWTWTWTTSSPVCPHLPTVWTMYSKSGGAELRLSMRVLTLRPPADDFEKKACATIPDRDYKAALEANPGVEMECKKLRFDLF